jgi:hypothetical protein
LDYQGDPSSSLDYLQRNLTGYDHRGRKNGNRESSFKDRGKETTAKEGDYSKTRKKQENELSSEPPE